MGYGAAAVAGAHLWRPKSALAFGQTPEGAESSVLPAEKRAKNVLEIFLYGGLSQYESFYCVPSHGVNDATHYYAFQDSIEQAANNCGYTGALTEPFGVDALGQDVHLGPFAAPLRARPDIRNRTRVCVTRHDLEPHEAAIPLALGGRGLGHPGLAGLGSHIQRFALEQGATATAPQSYVLLSNDLRSVPTDNVRAASTIGLHPGAARPLSLYVDGASELTTLLERSSVGSHRQAHDSLIDAYIAQTNERLRYPGSGEVLRAARLSDLTHSARAMTQVDALAQVLAPELFDNVAGAHCQDSTGTDTVAMKLNAATHLLRHPISPARYICLIEGGLIPADGGGGYDSHGENTFTQARNLGHLLTELAKRINQPGETDPAKLNLDETLILLTTEFGRTPYAQGDTGRNHWPYGYPVVFIGGPVQSGVFGATGSDAIATTTSSSPQENRIAALLALGIWPFAQESYNVSDVPGAFEEAEAAHQVLERQLGVIV